MVIENYNSLCYFIIKQIFQCGYWLSLVKYILRYCGDTFPGWYLAWQYLCKSVDISINPTESCSLLSGAAGRINLEKNLHKYIQNIHNDVPGKRGTEERTLTRIKTVEVLRVGASIQRAQQAWWVRWSELKYWNWL